MKVSQWQQTVGKCPHSQGWEAQGALPALCGLPTARGCTHREEAGSTFPKQPGNLWILPSSWPRTGPSGCRSASWCPSSRKPPWASQCSASVPSASTGETQQPPLPCLPCPLVGARGRTRSSFPGQCQDGNRLLSRGAATQQELSGDRAEILLGKAEGRIMVWVGW